MAGVMPDEIARRCIKAGTKPGDTVLDPFSGAGTTALTADRLGRSAIGIELNADYRDLAHARVTNDAPLFAEPASSSAPMQNAELFA
jgi:DNA modification methylase